MHRTPVYNARVLVVGAAENMFEDNNSVDTVAVFLQAFGNMLR